MSPEPRKLQKIRTFRGDVSAIKNAAIAVAAVTAPEEISTPVKPQVTLAPVLNERKDPIIVPPVVVKTATPPSPMAIKPAATTPLITPAPTSIQANVTATLNNANLESGGLIRGTEAAAIPQDQRVEVMDRGNDDLSGTVITNQKHDRFKLLPSMWEAIKLWFKEAEGSLERRAEKKRQAIPTVRTFEDRKDVIKKAASVGAIAPKDDYAKLAKKLPPRLNQPTAPSKSTVIIAEKAAVPAPAWGHYEGQTTPVLNEVKQVTPTVTQVLPPVLPPVPEPQPLPPPQPIVEPVVETPAPKPLPPPPPVEIPSVEQPMATETVPPPPAPTIRTETPRPPKPTPRSATVKTKRNFAWLFYVGVAATAVVAIVSGAGLVSWLVGESNPNQIVVTNGPSDTIEPTPIREDSIVKAILPRTKSEWYANVSASGRGGVISVLPVINIGGAEQNAGVNDVLAVLNWGVESAFIRSISDITFVMAEQKPVIVLEVSTFDAAFGGLLISEKALSGELSPLFGPVVTSTYKVGVGTVAPEFVDDLASNHDVRVLKDEMENERLVYGFIDQNTIIIAPDKETFSLISERLR